MTIHSLWVINKAGGLVFSRSYTGTQQLTLMGNTDKLDTLPPLALNDLLILAGTLHGIHAITARLSPAPPPGPPAGLQSFEAEGWGGSVYLTATGESQEGADSLDTPRSCLALSSLCGVGCSVQPKLFRYCTVSVLAKLQLHQTPDKADQRHQVHHSALPQPAKPGRPPETSL